jgi:hypothetical protein
VLDSVLWPIAGVELLKKVFTSRVRWLLFQYRVKLFRKYVLSFEEFSISQSRNLKLKCNNLIFNEILILYALYMCLLYSCFNENRLI